MTKAFFGIEDIGDMCCLLLQRVKQLEFKEEKQSFWKFNIVMV